MLFRSSTRITGEPKACRASERLGFACLQSTAKILADNFKPVFPADMPAFPVFTPGSNCRWASVAAWLPLVGMTGVIAYFQVCKKAGSCGEGLACRMYHWIYRVRTDGDRGEAVRWTAYDAVLK